MGKNAGALVGTVALAAVGGFTGGLFMPGAFSTLGASFGVMLGGALFAQPQPAGVSSVRDLKANKAEPTFLPFWCGDDVDDPARPGETLEGGVILPGIIIKTAPDGGITKVSRKAKSKGKSGTAGRLFGGPTNTETDYFLSCAIAWGEASTAHPGILRELWADEKLVFKLDADANEDGYIPRTPILDARGVEVGWQAENIRHYYGTGTQPVDDIVEAWYKAEGHHAPAFRNTEFTVITNYKIDGHVPNFYGRHTNGIKHRREQCRFFLLRANGLDGDEVLPASALNLTKMTGQSRGWYMTQPQAPAEIAQLIAARSLCALVEHSYQIHDVDLANPAIHTLEDWELAARDEGGEAEGGTTPRFKSALDDGRQKPSRVEIRIFDIRKRDENSVPAIMPTATYESVQTFDLPTVDTEEEIAVWGAIMMDVAWVAEPGAVSALPRRITATAGDVLRVPVKNRPGQYTDVLAENRIVAAPGAIQFEGHRWSAETYRNRPTIVPTPRPVDARTWAAPILFVANSVCLTSEMLDDPGVVFAATQTPNYKWERGCETKWEVQDGNGWDEFDSHITEERAVMGQLLAPWNPPSPYEGYVTDRPMAVEMFWGELVTASIDSVRAGANVILFEVRPGRVFCGSDADRPNRIRPGALLAVAAQGWPLRIGRFVAGLFAHRFALHCAG